MASELLFKPAPTPSAIILADSTDYAPGASAANNFGARTHQLDLTSLASGSYRQSDKFDLGVKPASLYAVYLVSEFAAGPSASRLIKAWFAWSNFTAGRGNVANLSGSDSAYTGYSSNADDAIQQLGGPHALMPTTVQTLQVGFGGYVMPTARYGICVVQNDTDQALQTDAVEMAVVLLPLVIESQ